MPVTDPVADMLTRIRNALVVKKEIVDMPASKMKASIARIMLERGLYQRLRNDGRRHAGHAAHQTEIWPERREGYFGAQEDQQARPSRLCAQRSDSQGAKRPWNRHYFDKLRRYYRCRGEKELSRRRGFGVHLVGRCKLKKRGTKRICQE